MLKVKQVSKAERRLSKPRLYIWPVGESIMDNLLKRHSRPYREYRKLLPEIFRQAGIAEDTKASWSQYAGCSCLCSPGFVLETTGHFDLYVDVEEVG